MAKWTPCGAAFVESDVIRWFENVWHKRRYAEKHEKVGMRWVTGQVTARDVEWADVTVWTCESVPPGVEPFKKGEKLRRKVSTMEKGSTERMLWSDESARAVVASRFLGPEGAKPAKAGKSAPAMRAGAGGGGSRGGRGRRKGPKPKLKP